MKNLLRTFLAALTLISLCVAEKAQGDWQLDDIGAVDATGSATESSGVYTITGSGAGVDGTADAFSYMSQARDGDFEITARVTSLTTESPYTAAGLALRQDLSAGSPNVFLSVASQNGVNFSSRTRATGSTFTTLGPSVVAPVWLRLQKVGTVVVGYMSNDGTAWSLVGWDNLTFTGSYRAGVGVGSAIAGTLATAQVDNVRLVSNFPLGMAGLRLWLRADAGVNKGGTNALNIWEDQSGNGNDASQSVLASQPTWIDNHLNGYPSIAFNGTSSYLSALNSVALKATQLSAFVVGKYNGGTGNQAYLVKANTAWTNGYGIYQNSTNAYGFVNNFSSPRAGGAFASGSFGLLSLVYNTQNLRTGVGAATYTTTYSSAINYDTSSLTIGDRRSEWRRRKLPERRNSRGALF
jgi:hypothetical protein